MADRQIVLLIEDNPGDVRLIREMLARGRGCDLRTRLRGEAFAGLEYLATGSACLVLLDLPPGQLRVRYLPQGLRALTGKCRSSS